MAAKKDSVKVVQKLADEFFTDLNVDAEVVVSKVDSPEEEGFCVSVRGEELGPIIGYHGETLNALQLILSLIVSHKLDSWARITLNAGDWRERREESLEVMALRAAEKAVSSGSEVEMPTMSAGDRRLIHLALKDHPEVISESSGDGPLRRIVIKPT
jgi:spoIIIJ-associated protein